MALVGERPKSGVRIDIARPREGGPPFAYEGTAATPEADFPVRVTIAHDGAVDVVLAAAEGIVPPGDLAERIRLLVRTAAKGEPEPARKIVRWRPGRETP